MTRRIVRARAEVTALDKLLTSLSPKGPLSRGYVLAHRADGSLARSAGALAPGERLSLEFVDGRREVIAEGIGRPARPRPGGADIGGADQGDLF
jgi:exodeoxyribonuclease VII large subunit